MLSKQIELQRLQLLSWASLPIRKGVFLRIMSIRRHARDRTCMWLGHSLQFHSHETDNSQTPAKKLYEDGNEEWLASYLSQVRA